MMAENIMGPMPKTAKGYEYAFILKDLFTRWTECIPLRKANAKSVLGQAEFKVGDLVWKRSHTLSSTVGGVAAKLVLLFNGLYTITAKVGPNTFKLGDEGGRELELIATKELKK